MQTTAELREGYLAFFEEKGHLRCPSASLIPRADDHSTLLTSAGMQPQMPYFLGREAPPAPTTTTCQKVFRTPDIDEVGLDTYHLTFFEMLGNFSFGQYFKEGAISFAAEFLRDRLGLDWDRIWVSVHAGDPELKLGPDQDAIDLWEQIGMPPERIVPLPSSENFWSVGGPGPCGPDSEIYYDWGEEVGCAEAVFPAAHAASASSSSGTSSSCRTSSTRTGPDAAAEAEHRHRHGPGAHGAHPAERAVRVRHRRLPADHELDRRRVRRSPTATRSTRPRRTGCSPTTAAG